MKIVMRNATQLEFGSETYSAISPIWDQDKHMYYLMYKHSGCVHTPNVTISD